MTNMSAGAGETKEAVSAWTVDSLNQHYAQILNERDRRYEQRFQASEKAVADAAAAAEKAVNAAFASQEKSVSAALAAAERAVSKAEAAAEKRFDNVNEFRGQLADQAATFLARGEYNAQHTALEDKVEASETATRSMVLATERMLREATERNAETITALGLRIERAEGQRGGLKDGWGYLIGAAGFFSTLLAIAYALSK